MVLLIQVPRFHDGGTWIGLLHCSLSYPTALFQVFVEFAPRQSATRQEINLGTPLS